MQAAISYIIKFLIGNDHAGEIAPLIGYTANRDEFHKYALVFIPSDFFSESVYGKPTSLPQLPLTEIDGIPILFGKPCIEMFGETLVVHADLIASAYFLLTRYEEIRKRELRDSHGRFPGNQSLPYKAGFIHRPIVDEYGGLIRKWLREQHIRKAHEPQQGIRKVWLTHDIDIPFYCRSVRSVARESIRGAGFRKAWNLYKGKLEEDPFYTFPWLFEQNSRLQNKLGKSKCETLFFFKAGGKSVNDKPHYSLYAKDIQTLLLHCRLNNAAIGLHSSYDAGKAPGLIREEKRILSRYCDLPVLYNRHHFLRSCEPEDLDWLEKYGFTDDFTMGYPDVAGFRLGTSRPVNWINPENKRLSSLKLHPLQIMDVSLSESNYMGFNYEEALNYSISLIQQIRKVGGELVLLWHNNTISEQHLKKNSVNWQRRLYEKLLEELMN